MTFLFALLGAVFGLFVWMYLVTYVIGTGASPDVLVRARKGVFRGAIVALIFLIFQSIPSLSNFLYRDWVIFPVVFFLISLPWTWEHLAERSFFPIIVGVIVWFVTSFFDHADIFWSPFHEEVGKWYQSMTSLYPAILSPFVSLGFSFIENFTYYSADITLAQVIGRTLFSLPLHIFATLLAIFFYLRYRSSFKGIFIGILASVVVHFLYNWSLETSLILTLVIITGGYMFYGWSLENGWWKSSLKKTEKIQF